MEAKDQDKGCPRLTSLELDARFSAVCSQIGDLQCRLDDLETQRKNLRRRLASLKAERAQLGAAYRAVRNVEVGNG